MSVGVGYVVNSRYRLDRLIGRGGMGRVWGGHDANLDRAVAVKELILPDDLPADERQELVDRAMREARTAARLRHHGVITVHDVVTDGGIPWIVMELVQGASLADEIRERGAMDWRRVAGLGTAMAEALAHAHSGGVVHRDLKPENVLLAGSRAVIADFGIARVLDASTQLTRTGVSIGTPHYMAPEQLEGREATPASDMWSLGATLYALVEGRRPFEAPTLTALYVSILTQQPARPENAGPLAEVLDALLNKDPALRPDAAATADLLRYGLQAGASAAVPSGYTPTVLVDPRNDRTVSPSSMPFPSLAPTSAPAPIPAPAGVLNPESTSLSAVRPLFVCEPEQVVEQAWLQPVHAAGAPALALCLRGQRRGRTWSSVEVHDTVTPPMTRPVSGAFGSHEGVLLADGPEATVLTLVRRAASVSSAAAQEVVTVDPEARAALFGRPLIAPLELQQYTTGAVFRLRGKRGIALAGPEVQPVTQVGLGRWRALAGGFSPSHLLPAPAGIVIGWRGGTGRDAVGAVAWDGASGWVRHTFGDSRAVTGVAPSTSGTLVSISGPAGVSVHAAVSGEEVGRLPIDVTLGEPAGEFALVEESGAGIVLVHVLDRAIRLWSLERRRIIAELPGLGERVLAARLMTLDGGLALALATVHQVGMLMLPGVAPKV